MAEPLAVARPLLEVADVIRQPRRGVPGQVRRHLQPTQKKALRDLARCRTAALGGHVERCLDCGHERIAYNSCRNRHCPKCQALSRARWLEREATICCRWSTTTWCSRCRPSWRSWRRCNPHAVYDLLLQSAAETLRDVAANPQRLGAQVGVLMVLHTWGQNLHHHPHVHCVVTGGGLSCNERGEVDASPRWVSCRPGFFLPVRVLSRVFRGKFLAGLTKLQASGKLTAAAGTGRSRRLRRPGWPGCTARTGWCTPSRPLAARSRC